MRSGIAAVGAITKSPKEAGYLAVLARCLAIQRGQTDVTLRINTMKSDLSNQQQEASSGPDATDDLTIAENLRVWKLESSGEGAVSYSDGENSPFSITVERAREFLEEFGPLHPGDYKAQRGSDWREDFIMLSGMP